MRTNITSSIQEYCKKINSALSFTDVVSLLVTTIFLSILLVWITLIQQGNYREVIYSTHSLAGGEKGAENSQSKTGEDTRGRTTGQLQSARPFGSKKGKTYTFIRIIRYFSQLKKRLRAKGALFLSCVRSNQLKKGPTNAALRMVRLRAAFASTHAGTLASRAVK